MPRVLKTIDNKVVTLFDERDLEYYIEKYMGYEFVQYFRELLAEKDEAHREEIEELKYAHEEKLEELQHEIDSLEERLEERDE